MIRLRPAAARGHAEHGWLDSHHSFSFADYYDPAEMGWGVLRVINEDRVAPGMGFGTHGHRDMEIISVVLDGELQHRDSMGNGAVIRPGEVQRMSAGTGVMHSEFNASQKDPVHFLQIWLQPSARGIAPSYEQKDFAPAQLAGRLQAVVTPEGEGAALRINQDASLYRARLAAGESVRFTPTAGRLAYLHLIEGAASLNGTALATGDGARIADEALLEITASAPTDLLLFDLPPAEH
ncbi:pirin family protein [Niveibacterium sp. SC-1]|uniref:pirin family protein n=1 Tax=Niveibacterium sp. SC-1 TaxID=3135646 RepID=UPI00311DFEB7